MASLIGYGEHAKDIEAIYLRCDRNPLAIYDDDPATGLYAPPKNLKGRILIGVNSPIARRKIAERFGHLRGTHPLVDPTAVTGLGVKLGKGCVVAPFASLLRSVALGQHVHVNYHASMTRCTVGDFTTISPGVVICGDVTIGSDCLIGANATVCDRVIVGNNVIVGAGALIPPLSVVPDNTKVIGVWKNA